MAEQEPTPRPRRRRRRGPLTRLGIVLAGLALLASIGAGIVVFNVRSRDALTSALGRQIFGIIGTYIRRDLACDALTYRAPFELTLGGLRMLAPDGRPVIAVDELVVVLAEVPKRGSPIRIARLRLSGGEISLRTDASGGLAGFGGDVTTTEAERDAAPSEFRLSNVLRLDEIEIEGVDLAYAPSPDAEPLRIDDLRARLLIRPAEAAAPDAGDGGPSDAPAGPGWYAVNLAAGRAPGIELAIDGRLNIDDPAVWTRESTLSASLDGETLESLPPALRDLLTAAGVRGRLTAAIAGRVDLASPSDARGELTVAGHDLFADLEGYRIPIDRLDVEASYADGLASLRTLRIETLGGEITARAEATLGGAAMPAEARLRLRDVELANIFEARTDGDGTPSQLAGKVTATITATTDLADPLGTISGDGELSVREGLLVVIPIIDRLARTLDVSAKLRGSPTRNHRLDAAMTIGPAGVTMTRGELVLPALAARFTGPIGWDQRLDLTVNAGVLERMQASLGAVGDIFGGLTDRIGRYHVRGTLGDPAISVSAAGLGG